MKTLIDKNKQYHIIYRTHNLINGKEYTGKHSTNKLDDGYYGSGSGIMDAFKKYGIENFAVEILSFHLTEEIALAEEERIVDDDYIERDDTYNKEIGGGGRIGESLLGKVIVKDKNNNKFSVLINDSRYISGELVGHTKGDTFKKSTVKKIKCPYCNKIGIPARMYQWHFSHCKLNPSRIKPTEMPSGKSRAKLKTLICPHCGKKAKSNVIKRWHFDNCKHLNIDNYQV